MIFNDMRLDKITLGESVDREKKESSYRAMGNLISKSWGKGILMRNKERNLRSGQGCEWQCRGTRAKRVWYPGNQGKNVFQSRGRCQLCQTPLIG